MLKVEIRYNPYTLEYVINLNGREPRINSQLEKYQKMPLHRWVNELPEILYEEMNGYEFEIVYSGTELEYNEIVEEFRKRNISENEVKCISKSFIEDRFTKIERMENIKKWLEDNPCKLFDLSLFKSENSTFYDDGYSLIYLGINTIANMIIHNINITSHTIQNFEELKDVQLDTIPIVVDCDQIDLGSILDSNKIHDLGINMNQLFFMTKNSDIKKELCDYRISNPLIINSLDEPHLQEYFICYSITEKISETINVFKRKLEIISKQLRDDEHNSEIEKETQNPIIKDLEEKITRLEQGIKEYDELRKEKIVSFRENLYESFITAIQKWEQKQINTTNNDEAKKMAKKLDNELQKQYGNFLKNAKKMYDSQVKSIGSKCKKIYEQATGEVVEEPKCDKGLPDLVMPSIYEDLMSIKDEKTEIVKSKPNLFIKGQNSEEVTEINVATYKYEKWRKEACSKATPIIEKILKTGENNLREYGNMAITKYTTQLKNTTNNNRKDFTELNNQLSEGAKLIQQEKKWIADFASKVELLERN